MSQLEDIQELLERIRRDSFSLSESYERAKEDRSINQIDRVSVKNALENLRSILDYCAIDIYIYINEIEPTQNLRIQFPIGRNKEGFERYLTNHSNLTKNKKTSFEKENPEIYQLISSLQPHLAGSDWLIDLHSYVNTNKHNKLTPQKKKTQNSLGIGNIKMYGSHSQVTFRNATINGLPVGKDSSVPVVIKASMTNDEINSQLNPDLYLPITRTVEDVKFYIDGSENDALTFIKEVTERIARFIDDLYAVINR
jgi:hypothetical protein